jgi:hypothetical protein
MISRVKSCLTGLLAIILMSSPFNRCGNVIKYALCDAGVLKDYLRELPEPLFTKCLYQMLLDALSVCLPDDPEGNAKLMFSILDCLPKVNRVINARIRSARATINHFPSLSLAVHTHLLDGPPGAGGFAVGQK